MSTMKEEKGAESWPESYHRYFELMKQSKPDMAYFRKVLESEDSKGLDDNIPMTPMTAIPLSPGLSKTIGNINSSWYMYFKDLWVDVKKSDGQTKNKFHGLDYFLVRYPLLICVLTYAVFELVIYFLVRQLVVFQEFFMNKRGHLSTIHKLRNKLKVAGGYEEWKSIGAKLDEILGLNLWKKQAKLKTYDDELIHKLRRKCAFLRKSNQIEELMEILQNGALKHNVGNVEDISLYSFTHLGTKKVVEDFYSEMLLSLDAVSNDVKVDGDVKKQFFKEVSQSYGRTALCLSGGAALGYMHLGVIKALLDSGNMPKIITGTSAGSIIASMYACRTDAEMYEILTPEAHVLMKCFNEPINVKLTRMIKTGSLFDAGNFGESLNWVTLGNTTFLEAYQRTGKILNITVVPLDSYLPPKLLNYITTPNVVIWSAILASSAVPGIINPITLMQKNLTSGKLEPYLSAGMKWRDGSLKMDIPLKALNTFFNIKYTIVSQVNPHIQLFFFQKNRVGNPSLVAAAQNSSQNQTKVWRGGFIFSAMEYYLKLDLKKWLHVVRDLELLPRFMRLDWSQMFLQKFDGNITILPELRFKDYLNIVTDPDFQQINYCLTTGQKATFPKLHPISNRFQLETKITSLLQQHLNFDEKIDMLQDKDPKILETFQHSTSTKSLNLSNVTNKKDKKKLTLNSINSSDINGKGNLAKSLKISTEDTTEQDRLIPQLKVTNGQGEFHIDLVNNNSLLEFMVQSFDESPDDDDSSD